MIVKDIEDKKDILNAEESHILIAINCQGENNYGLAKKIAEKYNWPELLNSGKNNLSTIIRKECNGKTIHALVCYSLDPEIGWKDAPDIIKDFLDDLLDIQLNPVAISIPVAAPRLGYNNASLKLGANVDKIRKAIEEAKRPVVIYHHKH